MPTDEYTIKSWSKEADRRQLKKKYWMDKGCTEWKAEKLLYRYGY